MKKILLLSSLVLIGCAGTQKPTITPIKLTAEQYITQYNNEFVKTDLPLVEVETPPSTAGQNGELQTWLEAGKPAPYSGVLFNPEGMAYIISEKEASESRATVAVEKQRDLDLAKLNYEAAKLQVELDTVEKKNEIIVKGRDEEIKRLTDLNKEMLNEAKKPWKKILIGVGSAVAGVGAGILIGSLTN